MMFILLHQTCAIKKERLNMSSLFTCSRSGCSLPPMRCLSVSVGSNSEMRSVTPKFKKILCLAWLNHAWWFHILPLTKSFIPYIWGRISPVFWGTTKQCTRASREVHSQDPGDSAVFRTAWVFDGCFLWFFYGFLVEPRC